MTANRSTPPPPGSAVPALTCAHEPLVLDFHLFACIGSYRREFHAVHKFQPIIIRYLPNLHLRKWLIQTCSSIQGTVESVFISRFIVNNIAPKLQKCWRQKIVFKIIFKESAKTNKFLLQSAFYIFNGRTCKVLSFYDLLKFYCEFCCPNPHHPLFIQANQVKLIVISFSRKDSLFQLNWQPNKHSSELNSWCI